ncbi:MAG: Na+/H+ antiporter subunit E [Erysipelotrichaceae bacterium]|nr:Na+/H+ antiporter subunit E [Erysipelotrichaceae bacterium]
MKRKIRDAWIKIKHHLVLGVVLMCFWLALVGVVFDRRMLLTGIVAVIVTLMFYAKFLSYFNLKPIAATHFLKVIRFSGRVMSDIFRSALAHMRRVIYGHATPQLFELQLSLEDPFLIALIANAITLTPGSMTVEVTGSRLMVLAFVDDTADIEKFRLHIQTRYEDLLSGGGGG